MSLMRIRLELARTPEFPGGSNRHGYEFVAPVDAEGTIDVAAWRQYRKNCRVTRFWDDEILEGELRHVGRGWRFDFDPARSEDDEPFFKLDRHPLVPGGYVSLTENDGVQRPFKIVAVTPFADRAVA